MLKVKKGDTVEVLSGNDKGKQFKVLELKILSGSVENMLF